MGAPWVFPAPQGALAIGRYSHSRFSFKRREKENKEEQTVWRFLTHNLSHFGVSLPLDALGETPINTNGSYRSTREERPPPCARCISP